MSKTVDYSANEIRMMNKTNNRAKTLAHAGIWLLILVAILLVTRANESVGYSLLFMYVMSICGLAFNKWSTENAAQHKRDALVRKTMAFNRISFEESEKGIVAEPMAMTYRETVDPVKAKYDILAGDMEDEIVDQYHSEFPINSKSTRSLFRKMDQAGREGMRDMVSFTSVLTPSIKSEIFVVMGNLSAVMETKDIKTAQGMVSAAVWSIDGNNVFAIDKKDTLYAPTGFMWKPGNPDELLDALRSL